MSRELQWKPVLVLASVSAANTAAATSAAIDNTGYEGELEMAIVTGAITGTVDFKIQDCDTSGGTYADVTGLTAAQISTANQVRLIQFPRNKCRRFIKLVGTVVTGPVLVGALLLERDKSA